MTLKSLMFTDQMVHDYTLIHVVKQLPGQEIIITGHWYEDKILNLMNEPIASLTWRSGPDLTVYLMNSEEKAKWELDKATASALRNRAYNRLHSTKIQCKVTHMDTTEPSRQEVKEALNSIFGKEITDILESLKGGD